MTPRPGHTLSRVLALILIALTAASPPVMVRTTDAPNPMSATMATAAAGHHHLPSSPGQHQRDDCCDLCLTSCIVCIGLISLPATVPSRVAPWVVPVIAVRMADASVTPNQHRLPFPLGPPALLA